MKNSATGKVRCYETRGYGLQKSAKLDPKACQKACTELRCYWWTMVNKECTMLASTRAKTVKGFTSVDQLHFSYCRPKKHNVHDCEYKPKNIKTFYEKKVKSEAECELACAKTELCVAMIYISAGKHCSLRLCRHDDDHWATTTPHDNAFKLCGYKPCGGLKGKKPATCFSKGFYVLESSKTTTSAACQAKCTDRNHCWRWTMMAGLCHLTVPTKSKHVHVKGMHAMSKKSFIFCYGKLKGCKGGIEKIYYKTLPKWQDCQSACLKSSTCSGLYYLAGKKLCTIRICQIKGSKGVAKPADKTFKPCRHNPCQGKDKAATKKSVKNSKKKPKPKMPKDFKRLHCHASKYIKVLESTKTTTSTACKTLCTKGHCYRWTMMAGLCHISVPLASKMIGMKTMTNKLFAFCKGRITLCRGEEDVFHKTMPNEKKCKFACWKTAKCSGLYYLTKKKLCTIRVCRKKGSKDVAKPADKTFKPCSHKPCQGKARKEPKRKAAAKYKLKSCHWHKSYKVLESKNTKTAAACKALCSKGHYCTRWTMMAGLCHLTVRKDSKMVGMKSMTEKQFTFCYGRYRCRGTDNVYHKKMFKVDECKTACSNTPTCSGMYYLTTQKLCTIRVCQRKGIKGVAKPTDTTFKPCSHKPCQGRAETGRRKGGSRKKKAGGLTYCHWHKYYKVLESKHTTTAAACKAMCSKGHYCTRWTMMAGLCHLTVKKGSKMVGMKSMKEKQITICSGRLHYCHGTENIYHKKTSKVDDCKTACYNTATCTAMYYLKAEKLCTIKVCHKRGSKVVAKPADKAFKPCSHKPCQGKAERRPRKHGSGRNTGRLGCETTRRLNLLESKKTTTSAHCKTLCSKGHCYRWTMMANLCHLTVSKHSSKLNGMKTMKRKQFTFCKGKMHGCNGKENVYHKKVNSVHYCKAICSKTSTCSGMYYLTQQKLCTIRVCQRKGSKGVAKPTDKTFKPCSHKPCQGHPRDETKALKKMKSDKKKPTKKTAKKKTHRKSKPLNCAMGFWVTVLESKKTTTAVACQALCTKGHCTTWTMMDGLCHLTVPKSSKLVGMKTMTEKQFTFCNGNSVCKGTHEHVYNKKKTTLNVCKSACSQTSSCSGMYYLASHKLCTMIVCQEKGKVGAKPADKTFKQCSHKKCHGKAVEEIKKKKGYDPKKFMCPPHYFMTVRYSKSITTSSACAKECTKIGSSTCLKWALVNGACHLVCNMGYSNSIMTKLSYTEYNMCLVKARIQLCKAAGKESMFHKTVKTKDECKEACAHTTLCSAAYFLTKTKHCSIFLCKTKKDTAEAKPYDKTFKPCAKSPCTGVA